jgi:hypothetical protein
VLDLALHGDGEQNDEVDQENGPKHLEEYVNHSQGNSNLTGMFKKSKNVQAVATSKARTMAYQNLNSGSRRTKGRNSSSPYASAVSDHSAARPHLGRKNGTLKLWIHRRA